MAHDDRLRLQKLSQRLAAAFEASTQWHRQRCERTADALRLVAATRELNISALLAQAKPAVPVSGVNDLTLVPPNKLRLGDRTVKLGPNLFALFKLLSSRPGKLVEMDEVHKLWGADGASGANIRVHIHLLRQKLDELGVSDLIHIVPPELGYVFGQRFQPIDPARPGVLSYAPAGLLLDPHTRTAQRGDRYLEISPTLYEYLQRFMQKPEQIVRRSELAIISAGPGRDPASNSLVHKNIHGLRQALVAGGEPSVIITVREVGWTLEVPGPKPSSTS